MPNDTDDSSSEDIRYPRVENIELGIINLAFTSEELEEHETAYETIEPIHAGLPPSSSHPANAEEITSLPTPSDDESRKENDKEEKPAKSRDTWSNQIEFLLSCISMSVGLGNIWRYPFIAYENGGGAFLVPYFIVLFILGRPMYYLEMCLGQFSSLGPVKMWEISPIFKGIGYASMLAAWCICSFYCSIMAITVYYFYLSFSSILPWSEKVCNDPAHKTALCDVANGANQSFSELYYFNSVFPQLSDIDTGIGVPHWRLTICLAVAWVLIYVFLVKGIKSSGKVSYFTALFPYAVLVALLVRGATLPGAVNGMYYFIKPDWVKILDAKVWFAAVSQCFFSLNVGFGTIVYLSSHNRFKHNVHRDAIVIAITDTFTSCLAGCAIFALLGYLAHSMNVNIEEVTRGGPGLAFVAFPESIAHLDFFPQGFAVLFFLMLLTLGLGSAMSLVGQVITVIRDQYPSWKKWMVSLVVCTLGFISGIVYITPGGQFILTLVNHNGADFVIYVTAMIEVMAVSWVYGVNRFCNDIKFMLGRETAIYWKICWAFIMPVGLFTLLVYFFATYKSLLHEGVQFPTTAIVCGWLLSGIILSLLPIFAIHAIVKSPGSTWIEKIKAAIKPMPSWGPKSPAEREAWLNMKENREIGKSKVIATDQFSTASTVSTA